MVRFGGLTVVQRSKSEVSDITGLDAGEQIEMIRTRVAAMQKRQIECLNELLPILDESGIRRLGAADLSDIQKDFLKSHFESEILSSIAPVGMDPGDDSLFPAGLRLHLCVRLKQHQSTLLQLSLIHISEPTRPY